jgi:hypothetical protein
LKVSRCPISEPTPVKYLNGLNEGGKTAWFGTIVSGPQLQGPFRVGLGDRSRKHHNRQSSELGAEAQPGKDFESVATRHFQIQEQQTWQDEPLSIAERRTAAQIVDQLSAITKNQ